MGWTDYVVVVLDRAPISSVGWNVDIVLGLYACFVVERGRGWGFGIRYYSVSQTIYVASFCSFSCLKNFGC